jgi:putative tricarboxylic transport membrane protein
VNTLTKVAPNIVVIGLGIAAVVIAAGYGFLDEDGRIGPGFLPIITAALMAFFAAVNLVTSRRKSAHTLESVVEERIPGLDTHAAAHQEAGPPAHPAGDEDIDIYGRSQHQRNRMLWTVIAIVIATVLLVPLLGFMVAFAAMLVVVAVAVERRKILPSLVVSLITLGATYAIFVLFLRVPLPQGILGI